MRIGSTWVGSLPGGDTTVNSESLWPGWDEDQLSLSRAMDTVLSSLSADELDLLLLRYDHRVSLRDLGDGLGCGKDTVSRTLTTLRERVLRAIRELAGSENYQDARQALVQFGEDQGLVNDTTRLQPYQR